MADQLHSFVLDAYAESLSLAVVNLLGRVRAWTPVKRQASRCKCDPHEGQERALWERTQHAVEWVAEEVIQMSFLGINPEELGGRLRPGWLGLVKAAMELYVLDKEDTSTRKYQAAVRLLRREAARCQ